MTDEEGTTDSFNGYQYTPSVVYTDAACIKYHSFLLHFGCVPLAFASDLNCSRDVPTVESKREVIAGSTSTVTMLFAYFNKWQDKPGRHYLPSDVQKILLSHVTEFF